MKPLVIIVRTNENNQIVMSLEEFENHINNAYECGKRDAQNERPILPYDPITSPGIVWGGHPVVKTNEIQVDCFDDQRQMDRIYQVRKQKSN